MANRIDAPAKYELRSVIRFYQEEGNSAVEIYRRMSRVNGKNFEELGRRSKLPKKEKLQSNVKYHLASLAATFFEEGIRSLVYRYDKCLNLHGDNVEK
ncbi:hypothetical protein AVEN_210892-1 [Araneus ventricosus]|uniref:Mos1 transposase HTH domain-containing protein n=1 Tax=Araneus ventricosus TaxID=182803 RepID=A0A4Y2LK38_ARAVE|nr:hypothetical protein AVEN_210892-1 [Araneus ventricosus]